ncbi:ATP-binding cassette domain-containing protein [Bacillus chungangensis]|uniref:ABC-2 type transport system ATP-binding protein n=1 Tax=Bacillus chungangensis TaxID=587633 RepID=A0ABT9WRW3_9BACI|nr:ATP-binding cassette domain-containing protein [Bacillus chungangensis]MDQ0175964.1 ABC-2 type transport system ATP-binding protein [Bacillus chungangensis]
MIECKNISKKYGENVIIKNSSFDIQNNKISFLMGPNGHGKTTLIKCMMGMEQFQGDFLFSGEKINSVRKEILVLWDDCPFYTNLTGFKNLMIFSENKKPKKEIKEIASKFLGSDLLKNKVKHYSYGQKKKLALALVEILEPKYLIMDEISNGLDYEMIRYIQKLIKHWAKHTTVLLTGHQFSFYNEIIDDVFIFKSKDISLLVEDFQHSDLKLEDIYDESIV